MEQNHMRPPPLEARSRSQSASTTSYAHTPDPLPTLPILPTDGPSPAYRLPDVSGTALPPILPFPQHEGSLPSLSSVTGSHLYRDAPPEPHQTTISSPTPPANHWPSMNPLTQFYTPSHLQQSSPSDSPGGMDIDSSAGSRRGTSVNMDDPDVRMAAEALGDLRADFVSSPSKNHKPPPSSLVRGRSSGGAVTPRRGPSEPLLSLLTTAHPSIATTIEGATAAYTTGKNYSPRFKSGAEYVEGFVAPVANTVGSMGRAAGVEGGLRWYLRKAARGRRHKTTKEQESRENHKRRKVGKDAPSIVPVGCTTAIQASDNLAAEPYRRASVSTIETLPAYDEMQSPEYTESETVVTPAVHGQQPLKTRLFMTTSGLSIAMSGESQRSLKYCLQWLKWANGHISQVIESLKISLEQYDAKTTSPEVMEADQVARERGILVEQIAALKNDVLKTLQDAIQTVSKYAGGALPENARELVRSQLTSLPHRFFLAQIEQGSKEGVAGSEDEDRNEGQRAETSIRDGAQRVLVIAREGLDMMAQVSNVLDGTIVSAEEWCEKLGRKRRASQEVPSSATDDKKPLSEVPPFAPSIGDVSMAGQ